MPLHFEAIDVIPAMATVVATAMFVAVMRAGLHSSINRRLLLVLACEVAYAAAFLVGSTLYPNPPPHWVSFASFAPLVLVQAAYLLFLALLESPVSRWLRHSGALWVVGGVALLATFVGALLGSPADETWGNQAVIAVVGMVTSALSVLTGILGIVVTVGAYRRTAPRTPERERARWVMGAFVARDALWLLTILGGLLLSNSGRDDVGQYFWYDGPPLALLVYVPLLTYGILKAQVFDIDQKITSATIRSAVVGFVVIVSLVVSKIIEAYVNRNVGYVFGGVIAGLLLFFGPRLNKLAETMVRRTPTTPGPSTAYVSFRKLDLFRATLESAQETGPLAARERALLGRLQDKLGLRAEDVAQLEADFQKPTPPVQESPAPSGKRTLKKAGRQQGGAKPMRTR